MVKKEIKSIILYLDSAAAIDYLTDERAGWYSLQSSTTLW